MSRSWAIAAERPVRERRRCRARTRLAAHSDDAARVAGEVADGRLNWVCASLTRGWYRGRGGSRHTAGRRGGQAAAGRVGAWSARLAVGNGRGRGHLAEFEEPVSAGTRCRRRAAEQYDHDPSMTLTSMTTTTKALRSMPGRTSLRSQRACRPRGRRLIAPACDVADEEKTEPARSLFGREREVQHLAAGSGPRG